MDPDSVAKAFVEHYYTTFDANRSGLANLYQEASMLTFEGQKIMGSQNIVAKLTSLPFQQCQHSITTVDCQPSGPAGGMLVFVSGNLQLSGEQHALKFSQGFSIQASPTMTKVNVPSDAYSAGKFLCVERHFPVELCLKLDGLDCTITQGG
ncbi:hypothetical protein LguiA_000063 [Lonicera macranthoides]